MKNDKGELLLFGKAKGKDVHWKYSDDLNKLPDQGRPSKANHGNVTPSLKNEETKQDYHGGVTLGHALQTVVLSLPALRRLFFPVNNQMDEVANTSARTTLAALGLCAATLSVDQGCDLRSRCLLIPEGPTVWELVQANGEIEPFTLDKAGACQLLREAATGTAAKLPWKKEGLVLKPSAGLAALVRKSRELQIATAGESEE